jgi:hypothetical protein
LIDPKEAQKMGLKIKEGKTKFMEVTGNPTNTKLSQSW